MPSAAFAAAAPTASTVADAPPSASSTDDARNGVAPMFVSATLASAIEPFSRRTAAATPTIAQDCAVRWNFWYS